MSGPWKATVDRVVDGDTLDLAIELGFTVTVLARCRINGIDAPELSTPEGKVAKYFLVSITTGTLDVNHVGRDRYGRWLVNLGSAAHPSVADQMVSSGHARRWTP